VGSRRRTYGRIFAYRIVINHINPTIYIGIGGGTLNGIGI
jgi:hypothetical protein